jgi:hypothetical protein
VSLAEEFVTQYRLLALPTACCSNVLAALMISCKARDLRRFLSIASIVVIAAFMVADSLGWLKS